MFNQKLFFVTLVTLIALVSGLYLSGYLTLAFLKLDPGLLKWNTYLGYFRASHLPELAPYLDRIKWGGYLGFGVPGAAWLALTVLILKPRPKPAHGEARFATRGDLARHGLLKDTPTGLVIGKTGDTLIRLGGQQHAMLCAPTRSGKTVGVAIPVLLTYQDSVVAMDIKGELHAITSEWRKRQGHDIYVFSPFAEDLRTHRFNPLMCVSTSPKHRINQLQSLGAILYPDEPGKDPFWTNQSRTAFFGFALYMFEAWDALVKAGVTLDPNQSESFPSFERIYRLSSGDGKGGDMKAYLQKMLARRFVSRETRTALSNLASQAEQTFASILGSMQEPLQVFLNPILAAATNACDLNVANLRRRKTTIYVVISPDKLAEARKILNIFFSTVVAQNTRKLPSEDPALKHQCLLLMDEFTAMGRVDILASSISYTAGYGLRSLPIIQSLSQLDATYGPDVARTFVTNHGASIVFAPREQRDAEEYSRMLGDTTVRKRNRSYGAGGNSYTVTEERRALMLPQELKAMGMDEQIVFCEGVSHPVRCKKIKYYSDRFFKPRLLGKTKIPDLRLYREDAHGDTVIQDDEAIALLSATSSTSPTLE